MLSFIRRPFHVKHLRDFRFLKKSTWRHYKSTAEADDWSNPSGEPRDASKYKAKQDRMKANRTLYRAECFSPLREEKMAFCKSPRKSSFPPPALNVALQMIQCLNAYFSPYKLDLSCRSFPQLLHIFHSRSDLSHFSQCMAAVWLAPVVRGHRALLAPAPSYFRLLYHRLSAVSPDVSPPSPLQIQPISTAALCDQIPCLSQTTN